MVRLQFIFSYLGSQYKWSGIIRKSNTNIQNHSWLFQKPTSTFQGKDSKRNYLIFVGTIDPRTTRSGNWPIWIGPRFSNFCWSGQVLNFSNQFRSVDFWPVKISGLWFGSNLQSNDGKPEHPMPIAVVLNKVDLRETNPAMVQIERDEIIQTLKLHSSQVSFWIVTNIATLKTLPGVEFDSSRHPEIKFVVSENRGR